MTNTQIEKYEQVRSALFDFAEYEPADALWCFVEIRAIAERLAREVAEEHRTMGKTVDAYQDKYAWLTNDSAEG